MCVCEGERREKKRENITYVGFAQRYSVFVRPMYRLSTISFGFVEVFFVSVDDSLFIFVEEEVPGRCVFT